MVLAVSPSNKESLRITRETIAENTECPICLAPLPHLPRGLTSPLHVFGIMAFPTGLFLEGDSRSQLSLCGQHRAHTGSGDVP